jgi:hypothetical protein
LQNFSWPSFISWDQFLANQARLADNASDFAIVVPQTMRSMLQGRVGSATVQLAVGGRLTTWHVVGIVQELFAPTCPCVSRAGFDQATGLADQANLIRIVTDHHDLQTRMEACQMVKQALADTAIKVQYVRPFNWIAAVSEGHPRQAREPETILKSAKV